MQEALTFFDKEGTQIWSLIENNPEHLHSSVRDDGYTPWQILVHIVTATQGVTAMGLGQIDPAGGWFVPQTDFNLDAWNMQQQDDWEQRSLDDLREVWERIRPAFVLLTQQATDEHKLLHPVGRRLSGSEYIQLLTVHIRMHRQELEAGLKALKESAA